MTTPRPESRAQRSATRAPVGRPINLQFDDSMDVVDGVCENISIGGMFIQVVNTRPPGSLVRFELQIDDSIAIRGLGEVVWNRSESEAATPSVSGKNEPGMGIKFRFLEQRDRQLIFKLVSQHIKDRLAKQQPPSIDEEFPIDPPAPVVSPPPAAATESASEAYDTATVTVPGATGGFDSGSFDLDDEEPTVIGQRFDEEPTVVGQRTTVLPAITTPPESSPTASPESSAPTFSPPAAAPSPPADSPAVVTPPVVSPPTLESFAEAPIAPPPPTPLPTPTSFVDDQPPPRRPADPGMADSFDSELAQLRGAPLSGELASVDHGLDRGDVGGSGPRDFGEAPFDDLLGGTTGQEPSDSMPEYSVVDKYDLGTKPRRSPVVAVAALVLIAAIAAGYWFREEIFGLFGNEAVETAFGPATVGGSDPAAETTATPEGTPPVTQPPSTAASPAGSNTTAAPSPTSGRPASARRTQAPPPPTTRPAPPPRASARPAKGGGFSKVTDIRWQAAAGGLRVIIETDGAVPTGRWRQFGLGGDSPREVIRLLGVRSPYGRSQIAVDHPILRQIRTGFHRKSAGNELHVVLDLADSRVKAGDVSAAGDRLEIVLSAP